MFLIKILNLNQKLEKKKMEKVLKGNHIYLFLKVHQLRKKELISQQFFLLLKIIYQVQEVVGKIGKLILL